MWACVASRFDGPNNAFPTATTRNARNLGTNAKRRKLHARTQTPSRQTSLALMHAQKMPPVLRGSRLLTTLPGYNEHENMPRSAQASIVLNAQSTRSELMRADPRWPRRVRAYENHMCVQAQGARTEIGKPTTVIEKSGYASPYGFTVATWVSGPTS